VQGTTPSVLLVDDDAGIREALTEVLVDEGLAVHTAPNGQEALEWLRQHGSNGSRPCVVLLDLMMPVMDGRAFLAVRDADPWLSTIPVLVISADAGCGDLADNPGVHGVFRKPLALDELLEAIARCV
jgi:two-component system chemotaxis response regulator CheY